METQVETAKAAQVPASDCERKTVIFRPPKLTFLSTFNRQLSAARFAWGFSLTRSGDLRGQGK
jgi:hypothetical protein